MTRPYHRSVTSDVIVGCASTAFKTTHPSAPKTYTPNDVGNADYGAWGGVTLAHASPASVPAGSGNVAAAVPEVVLGHVYDGVLNDGYTATPGTEPDTGTDATEFTAGAAAFASDEMRFADAQLCTEEAIAVSPAALEFASPPDAVMCTSS